MGLPAATAVHDPVAPVATLRHETVAGTEHTTPGGADIPTNVALSRMYNCPGKLSVATVTPPIRPAQAIPSATVNVS